MPRSVAWFSFDPAPGPATTRSVFFDTEPDDLCAIAFRHCLRLVARHPLQRAGKYDRLARNRRTGTANLLLFQRRHASREQVIDRLAVVLLGEKVDRRFRHDRSDTADADDLLPFGIAGIALAFGIFAASAALRSASKVWKCRANLLALVSPIWRMPSA